MSAQTSSNTQPSGHTILAAIEALDQVDLVTLFALELSAAHVVQTAICSEISTHMPEVRSGSKQEALAAQMLEMLTARIEFEVVGMPFGRDDFKYQIYLFGTEHPMFSFSLRCFDSNPTLAACLVRMLMSGYEDASGARFFGARPALLDRTRVEMRQFAFNDLLARHFFRGGLLLRFITVFISGIDILFADRYPDIEVARRAETLLERVLADVESRLTQTMHVRGSSLTAWVTPRVMSIVNQLAHMTKSPSNVNDLYVREVAAWLRACPPIKLV